jgi:hypothetical protein
MRNYLTSGGLLEEGRAFRDSQFEGQQQADSDFESMPPMRPRNPAEDEYFRRTMVHVGQDADGTNLYHTPERSIYMKNKLEYQAQLGAAEDAYNKKMNNPFFKATDFVTDLVRNTVGAPFNFLTDGVAFQSDPSKSALQGYKAKIQELSDLQEMNLEYFSKGRKDRAEAFANSVAGINDITPSHYTAESLAKYRDSGNIEDLVRYNMFETITDNNTGEIYQINRSTGEKIVIKSVEQAQADSRAKLIADDYVKHQSTFRNNQSKLAGSLTTAQAKSKNLSNQIQAAVAIISKYPNHSTGFGGLMQIIPDTEATQLKALLDTVKSNVAFAALQEMRNNSPTGGALGNVSNIEIELLYQNIAPLLQTGSAQDLITSLQTIDQMSKDTLAVYERAYREDERYYGGREGFSMLNTEQPTSDTQNTTQAPVIDEETQRIMDEIAELEAKQKR